MSVYVDPLFSTEGLPRTGRWPYDNACHMTADTHRELVEMARDLGLRFGWIQHYGRATEHFDLTPSKRAEAVKRGAVEITREQAGRQWREKARQEGAADA